MAKFNSHKKVKVVKAGSKPHNQEIEMLAKKIAKVEKYREILDGLIGVQKDTLSLMKTILDDLKKSNHRQMEIVDYVYGVWSVNQSVNSKKSVSSK